MILNDNHSIEIFGNSLKPRYKECQDGFIHLSSQPINAGFFVVPDNAVDENCKVTNTLIGQYKAEDKTGKAETEKILMGILENIDSEKKILLAVQPIPQQMILLMKLMIQFTVIQIQELI